MGMLNQLLECKTVLLSDQLLKRPVAELMHGRAHDNGILVHLLLMRFFHQPAAGHRANSLLKHRSQTIHGARSLLINISPTPFSSSQYYLFKSMSPFPFKNLDSIQPSWCQHLLCVPTGSSSSQSDSVILSSRGAITKDLIILLFSIQYNGHSFFPVPSSGITTLNLHYEQRVEKYDHY